MSLLSCLAVPASRLRQILLHTTSPFICRSKQKLGICKTLFSCLPEPMKSLGFIWIHADSPKVEDSQIHLGRRKPLLSSSGQPTGAGFLIVMHSWLQHQQAKIILCGCVVIGSSS